MSAIEILGIVEETGGLDPEFLYSAVISEKLSVEDHYEAYAINDPAKFSFLKYPYILNPAAKLDVIRHENRLIQAAAAAAAAVQHPNKRWSFGCFEIVWMFRQTPTDRARERCTIRVRRSHLLKDGIAEIARQKPEDLNKKVMVQFIGEQGDDQNGLSKEFFRLLFDEIVDSSCFVRDPESSLYWFSTDRKTKVTEEMAGLVLGMALFNQAQVNFPVSPALFRMLVGQRVRLVDIESMHPSIGRTLRKVLTSEDVSTFGLTFTFGDVPIVEGGCNIEVTNANRVEFVEKVVDYLTSRTREKFESFKKGFWRLLTGPAWAIIRDGGELEKMVCGTATLDFENIKPKYTNGFESHTDTILWLWEVVLNFDAQDQRSFLKFFTGSDRAPIGGLGKLKCAIQHNGTSDALPSSQTCFNTLLMPMYPSKEVLMEKLKMAIDECHDFGNI
jgi:hypothetical protein